MKKATIITYGCQMNVNETAKMKKTLINMGYELTENISESDAIFLNTCTVREGAATQIYGKLGELKIQKEKQGSIIGVTGCFAQEQGEDLAKKFPIIDIIMGNQNISKLQQAIEKIESGDLKHVIYVGDEDELPPQLDSEFDSKYIASVPISYGCDKFCTFCIVPYVRGRERSVPMADILADIKNYVGKGAREIILLGQNVNSYGKDFKDDEYNFARLLNEIQKIDGDFWVRFISPHPRDFSDDVIEAIANNDKISKWIHLPLQSGSTRILKYMNRGYTKEEFITLAEKIKARIPSASLSTDIIVGFPHETEQDFLDTIDVVEKLKFENSYMFMYSKRKGTKAEVMDEQVDEETKNLRLQRLIERQNKVSLFTSKLYLGKTEKILVEGRSKKKDTMLTGRTSTNKVALFKGDSSLEGKFVNIKINDCKTWTIYGELLN
ncbi:MAG: tRNA (N6-isopentenyl adenosine(37)-C2)-methylthiotransferase MiaB [Fusobacteriaceae bacterium]